MMKGFVDDVEAGQHSLKGWANTCYGMSKLGLIAYSNVSLFCWQLFGMILVCTDIPRYLLFNMSAFDRSI